MLNEHKGNNRGGKKVELQILLPAQCDIERIALIHHDYVGVESARAITDAIYDTLDHLQRFPDMGFLLPAPELSALGYRGLICEGRYLSVYRRIDGAVYVYRILDTRSDYPKLLSRLPEV